jgi:hypothetical protein
LERPDVLDQRKYSALDLGITLGRVLFSGFLENLSPEGHRSPMSLGHLPTIHDPIDVLEGKFAAILSA